MKRKSSLTFTSLALLFVLALDRDGALQRTTAS